MKKSAHLTPGEFELIEILWPLGEASVKQVWEKVNPARGLAYTTVMTVLEKMHRKGILSQRRAGKAYLYSPNINRVEALQGVFQHMSESYFGGSMTDLVNFVKAQELSPATEEGVSAETAEQAESERTSE
jgi:BlaI family penicillinase repressor